jgi:hypothetical protein
MYENTYVYNSGGDLKFRALTKCKDSGAENEFKMKSGVHLTPEI